MAKRIEKAVLKDGNPAQPPKAAAVLDPKIVEQRIEDEKIAKPRGRPAKAPALAPAQESSGLDGREVSDGEMREAVRMNGKTEKSLHRFPGVKMYWTSAGVLVKCDGKRDKLIPRENFKDVTF